MAKKPYLPHSTETFLNWLIQFQAGFQPNMAAGGGQQADVTLITTGKTALEESIAESTAANAAAKQATANVVAKHAKAEADARALARRIKAHPGYTVGLGNIMGIEGPENTTDLATLQPKLTGEDKRGGVVEIGFDLRTSEGVNLYSWREGDIEFKYLARDTCSPYVDNRPLLVAGKPEKREYQGWFVRNDEEYGQASDIIVIICAP